MIKLRPVQYTIQPVVVADDGEDLSVVEVPAFTVAVTDIADFQAKFLEYLEEQEAALNAVEEDKK